MATYKYELLEAGLNIRLLVVYPGREEDCMRCSLKRATLNTDLRHIALLYTWGDQKHRRATIVDD